jgi:hypothetical protein
MLDQQLRGILDMIWMSLPRERQTVGEVEKEMRRLTDRALSNMADDLAAFGLPSGPDDTVSPSA